MFHQIDKVPQEGAIGKISRLQTIFQNSLKQVQNNCLHEKAIHRRPEQTIDNVARSMNLGKK